MAARLQAMGLESYGGTTRKSGERYVWSGKVHLLENVLDVPLTWKKPRLVFVNSMSDLFQDAIPFSYVDRIWDVMALAQMHTFQVLTKQPDRMAEYLKSRKKPPLKNVWVGTSVESAEVAGRIAQLRKCKAAVRFVSFEPLIGPVGKLKLAGIHWAIVGGESGPRARTMNPLWAEEVFDQCVTQDVAFFFKQWGGVNKKLTGRLFKGQTWDQLPTLQSVYAE